MKIKSITPEQEAHIPEYVEKWLAIGLSTEEINQEKAFDAVRRVYEVADFTPPPRIEVVDSPIAGIDKYLELKYGDDDSKKTPEEANRALSDMIFGAHDSAWLCFYDFFLTVVGVKECEALIPCMDLAKDCGWWAAYDDVAIIQHKPIEIHRDEQSRLHNMNGMAIKYRDGFGLYSVHGVIVPENVIMDKENITIEMIDNESNLEVRRVMVDMYDVEEYVKDSGAKVVHSDEWGTLYEKVLEDDDEPIKFVEVINSTPNGRYVRVGDAVEEERYNILGELETVKHQDRVFMPDEKEEGQEDDLKFKHYFLRVPPDMETAHQAVAWTFGETVESYNPDFES